MIGFSFRAIRTEDDVPRLVRLLEEIEAADGDGEESDEGSVRESLGLPGHDPARDRWVVEEPGTPDRLIAHGLIWKAPKDMEADTLVVVHPAWRGRGLGSELLSRILHRADELGTTALRAYASERNEAGRAFLQHRGFVPVAAYTEMRFQTGKSLPEPAWPAGYRVSTFHEVNDLKLLARAMTAAYSGQWGHHAVGEEDLAAWLPQWNPEGIFLLFDGNDEAVGICRVEEREVSGEGTVSFVDAPGIVPAHRDGELYVPLVLTALHWLREKGIQKIGLESWGDAEETLRKYGDLGFVVTRRAISYRLDVNRGA